MTTIQEWFPNQIVSQSEDFSPMYNELMLGSSSSYAAAAPYIVEGLNYIGASGLTVTFSKGVARASNLLTSAYPFLPYTPSGEYPAYIVFENDVSIVLPANTGTAGVNVYVGYTVSPTVSGQKTYTLTGSIFYDTNIDNFRRDAVKLARISTNGGAITQFNFGVRDRDPGLNFLTKKLRDTTSTLIFSCSLVSFGAFLGFQRTYVFNANAQVNSITDDPLCVVPFTAATPYYTFSLERGFFYSWQASYGGSGSTISTQALFFAVWAYNGSANVIQTTPLPNLPYNQTGTSSVRSPPVGDVFLIPPSNVSRFVNVTFFLCTNDGPFPALGADVSIFKRTNWSPI